MAVLNHIHKAYFNTKGAPSHFNVSHDMKRALRDSQVKDGLLTALAPGGTASLYLLENDSKIHEELKELIISYTSEPEGNRPQRKSGSGALESHLRASFLPKSVSIPVQDFQLSMSAWQELVVFDFDSKSTRLEVIIQVFGEGETQKDE